MFGQEPTKKVLLPPTGHDSRAALLSQGLFQLMDGLCALVSIYVLVTKDYTIKSWRIVCKDIFHLPTKILFARKNILAESF